MNINSNTTSSGRGDTTLVSLNWLTSNLGLTPTQVAELPQGFVEEDRLTFGEYDLVEQLGSGGTGTVFRGIERGTRKQVAVKVLKPASFTSEQSIKRFEKEARMLGKLDSQYVPKFLGFGQIGSLNYIVSELVDGVDLQNVLRLNSKLEPRLALQVIADVLKGLTALHEQGMVHRDVKPGNVIVCFDGQVRSLESGQFQIAKLTDFGLARDIDQSESMEITQQVCLGTPFFQAPEQFSVNDKVSPAADVYSVGATLYCMLTGSPPFESNDILELARQHRSVAPPCLSLIDDQISGAIETVVQVALEKNPAMRFRDAKEMLDEIQCILSERPLSIASLSTRQASTEQGQQNFSFQWELDCSLVELWPLVADTDRFNRAIDLPAPTFSFEEDNGKRKLVATATFNGMQVRWREHPFEWVQGKEMSVLREFEKGPFISVLSRVQLAHISNEKTRLIHQFQVMPRGIFGRIFSWFQFRYKTFKAIDKTYRRMEWIAQQQKNDPWACDLEFGQTQGVLTEQEQNLVSQKLRMVPNGMQESSLQQLQNFLIHSSDAAVTRIRPKAISRKLGCHTDAFLDFALHGSRSGLFALLWDVICPVCRIASNTFNSVKEIGDRQRCEACDRGFDVDFASSVELIFRIHPDIRKADTNTYCIGGPFHAPHIAAQLTVGAKERIGVELSMQDEAQLIVRGPSLSQVHRLLVSNDGTSSHVEIDLLKSDIQTTIRTGGISVRLKNPGAHSLFARLERSADRDVVLTASQVQSNAVFRELYPDQILSTEKLVAVTSGTVVGVRFFGVDSLASEIGETEVQHRMDRATHLLKILSNEFIVSGNLQYYVFEQQELALTGYHFLQNNNDSSLPNLQSGVVIQSGELLIGFQDGKRRLFGPVLRSLSEQLMLVEPDQVQSSIDLPQVDLNVDSDSS